MNKQQLKKCANQMDVKIRPPAKRFDGGKFGPEILPQEDRDWSIGTVTNDGADLHHSGTQHRLQLPFDQILDFMSDPMRGKHFGFLNLKVQVNIGGDDIWVDPIPYKSTTVVGQLSVEKPQS
jgi:hypothetical protein